ncbi:MAG: tRNA (guanosine(46)-N7)-methyltransferase TrmB [Pseudomonadales bacterium]|jgi:tRNA (guanine-N7-)-methyltransferase
MNEESKNPDKQRRIRSFVIRAGRMTGGQQRAYETLWPRFGLELKNGAIEPEKVFGNAAPVVLEIGFGMGDSLAQMAQAAPAQNFIGIEVHRPGVGRLLHLVEQAGNTNLRVYCDDAVEVLKNCIPDKSLDRLQLFFPDPWHKKRHHKRRLVQPDFMALVREKLVVGGVFHAATDWEPYAGYMLEVMAQVPGFKNLAASGLYSEKPDYRPETKFERRGERLGHGVWDLLFERVE